MAKVSTYIVAKNPSNKKWYVLGYVGSKGGRRQYMPVSDGFTKKADATIRLKRQLKADVAATNELKYV